MVEIALAINTLVLIYVVRLARRMSREIRNVTGTSDWVALQEARRQSK